MVRIGGKAMEVFRETINASKGPTSCQTRRGRKEKRLGVTFRKGGVVVNLEGNEKPGSRGQ